MLPGGVVGIKRSWSGPSEPARIVMLPDIALLVTLLAVPSKGTALPQCSLSLLQNQLGRNGLQGITYDDFTRENE